MPLLLRSGAPHACYLRGPLVARKLFSPLPPRVRKLVAVGSELAPYRGATSSNWLAQL